jgi:hypothetical protein
MKAEEAIGLLKTLDNKGFILTEEFAGIIALIEAQSKVVEMAREMVKCQNGGYLDFHAHYGKALKAAEIALAELEREEAK